MNRELIIEYYTNELVRLHKSLRTAPYELIKEYERAIICLTDGFLEAVDYDEDYLEILEALVRKKLYKNS